MRRRGFSLVESLVAMTLLLLAVVFIANLLPSSWLAVNQGEERLVASNMAQSLLEQTRSLAWASIAAYTPPPVDVAGTTMQATVEVDPVDPTKPRLKVVRVRVTWKSHGVDRSEVRQVTVCQVPR